MIYSVLYAKRFKRQYKRLIKSDSNLVKDLDVVIGLLANKKVLPDKNHNHKLIGNLNDCWECHVAPDWLLIYRYYHDILVLELIATGSHNDLF